MRESLDLAPYAAKLKDPNGAFRWDDERIEAALLGYREFLLDAALDKSETGKRPTRDVDEVWHLHILDTTRYGSDCNRLFGRFIHHVPSRTPADTCDSNVSAGLATCDSNAREKLATCSSDTRYGILGMATCFEAIGNPLTTL